MPSFALDKAQLVSLFAEAVFYGFFLVTFFTCIHTLLWVDGRLKSKADLQYWTIVAALLMLVFASLDLAFGLQLNLMAFIESDDDPMERFLETANWVNVMKLVTYVMQTFVGDSILIYRCWIIYGKNWMIVTPSVALWIAETVCGWVAVALETRMNDGSSTITGGTLAPFITTVCALTLAMNMLTTGLIAFRIKSIQQRIQLLAPDSFHSRNTYNAMKLLIESGAIYTTCVAILLVTYVIPHNASYLVSDCIVQVIGIVFNLIIIRVGNGTATKSMEETGAVYVPRRVSFQVRERRDPRSVTPEHGKANESEEDPQSKDST